MTQETILFLGPENAPLVGWLREQGEQVIQRADRLSAQELGGLKPSFLVSYGYRYILRKDILDMFPGRAINLHISFLPWNRGADPNFWSFVEGTPKGVTIHYLDEGVDTGDIIVQQSVDFDLTRETLETSYEKLQQTIQNLFKQNWEAIKAGKCQRLQQIGNGTFHKTHDKDALLHLLTHGWRTPVSLLVGGCPKNSGNAINPL